MLRHQEHQERSRWWEKWGEWESGGRESDAGLLWSDMQLPVSGRNDTGARIMPVPTLLSHSEPEGYGP